MSPGPGRVGAWLFALAPVADSAAGLMLLARRLREPATATMLDLISREYRQVETRLRLERYSRLLMFILLAAALLLLILSPRPVDHRENAYDALGRMAVVTAFLAVAWRKAKSRSIQIHRDWSVTSRT